jgi:flagella basal body P-ring formation protein FlgA
MAVSVVARADEIALKTSVRLEADASAVHLADIAELTGQQAAGYSELVIVELSETDEMSEITIQQVRDKLSEAGVHWGRVQLSGGKVLVEIPRRAADSRPLAMAPAALATREQRPPRVDRIAEHQPGADLVASHTLGGVVARMIAAGLRVNPPDLRLIFDPADSAFLETPEDAYRFEIQPLSNLRGDRIELAVRAWSEGRIQARRSLTVRPVVRAETVVAACDMDRDEVFQESDLTVERQWLQPSEAAGLTTLVQAVGSASTKPLRAGDVVGRKQVRSRILIERGDQAMVRCLVGGIVISLQAEARADGAEGETIEFRKIGERETFRATVTGPAEAVIDLSQPR